MERASRWWIALDWAISLALAIVGLVEIWAPLESAQGDGSPVASTIGVVLFAALLSQRRRRPPVALLGLLVWPVLHLANGGSQVLFFGGLVPVMVLTYSIARHAQPRWRWIGLAGIALLMLLADLAFEWLQSPSELIFHWAALTSCWLIGTGLRRSTDRAAAAAQHAATVESESRERTLRALSEERARIARELHDVVAHAVSVIIVQAGAAEQLVDDDPAHVRQALGTIRTTGVGALAEMRRLVAMLRVDDGADRSPQPGLDAVPALVEASSSGGLTVELQVEGTPRDLPAGLGLAAYRIVQEALTNVRRHANATAATVRLRYEPERLEIEVADNGHGGAGAEPHEPGHGLIGMRERAGMYGGELEASASASGYTVRAVLPVAA